MSRGLTLPRVMLREIQRSKLNTLLCLLTVVVATGLLAAMISISRGSVDATRAMMRDMGFNLLITPPGVDPARYQALDFGGGEMPEENVAKLTESTVMAQHIVGKYQKTISIQNATVVLTGVLAEMLRIGTEKTPMPTAYDIPRGEVFAGWAAARALDLKPGDQLTILDKPFKVARVLDEVGVSPEDIRIFGHLHDVQALLGVEGKVNAIDALACQCPVNATDIIAMLKASIHRVLPDVNIQAYQSILLARHEQRSLMARLQMAALAIVMVVSAAAIWGLTYQNVRNRRREIGVLRALGVPDWRIAALFLNKIFAYAAIGAVAGALLGAFGADTFRIVDSPVTVTPGMLIALIAITPFVTVLFGFPPILGGMLLEPAEVLGEDDA